MIEIPLGKVEFAEGVAFSFPGAPCCNCGETSGLRSIEQDTRLTTYMFGGGAEITFRLPLPFCPDCIPSAGRRPKTMIHRALVFLIAFGAASLGLIVLGDVVFEPTWLSQYFVFIALSIAALITGLLVMTSRPRGKQSSYFQPVRITKLRREFVSGRVTGIRFFFSNPEYARTFKLANQMPIDRRTIEITTA